MLAKRILCDGSFRQAALFARTTEEGTGISNQLHVDAVSIHDCVLNEFVHEVRPRRFKDMQAEH